jgi:hypothetical protein
MKPPIVFLILAKTSGFWKASAFTLPPCESTPDPHLLSLNTLSCSSASIPITVNGSSLFGATSGFSIFIAEGRIEI